MSQKTRAALTSGANSAYPDNTIGAITPLADRTQHIDEIDSGLLLAETSLQTVIGLTNYTGGLQVNGTNVVLPQINFISQESDFPTQDGSTITLEQSQWYIYTGAAFTTAKNFIVQDGAVLSSSSTVSPTLTYSGTGSMFTGVNASFSIRDIQIDHPLAQGFDFTDNVGGAFVFLADKLRMMSGTKYGTFNDLQTVLLEGSASLDIDDGVTITGTNIGIVSIDKVAFTSTDATFIGLDLGSSIAQTTETLDFIVNAPVGAVGISGLPNSGNIPVGRLGTVSSSEFNGGLTTPLSGITNEDVRWVFSDNVPIADTIIDAMVSLSSNATPTVITTINTPVLVAGTWVVERDSLFTGTTAGRVTYNGERDTVLPVDITITIIAESGTNKDIHSFLAVNGVIVPNSGKQNRVGATDPKNTSVLWQLSMSENDYLEVFIENNTDTVNLIATDAILRAR